MWKNLRNLSWVHKVHSSLSDVLRGFKLNLLIDLVSLDWD